MVTFTSHFGYSSKSYLQFIDHLAETESKSASFSNIFKSNSLLGGSMIINIVINLIRVKCMAILLGPFGIGIYGILSSIYLLGSTFGEMGIFMSSVREISYYRGKNNNVVVNELIRIMRFLPYLIGLIPIILLATFSGSVSQFSFDSSDMQYDIMLLGLAIGMHYIIKGNQTLMQAFQLTRNLSKYQIIAPAISTIISLLLYYLT